MKDLTTIDDSLKFPAKGYDSTTYWKRFSRTVTSAELKALLTTPIVLLDKSLLTASQFFICGNVFVANKASGGTAYTVSDYLRVYYENEATDYIYSLQNSDFSTTNEVLEMADLAKGSIKKYDSILLKSDSNWTVGTKNILIVFDYRIETAI